MYAAHPTKCLLLYAAAGIGILSIAAAQDDVKGSISVLQTTSDKAPWGEPRTQFDSLLKSPNATGTFPVAGVDISASLSTSSTIDNWYWSIALAADLPVLNSSNRTGEYRDKVYTGGKVTFNAPSSLINSSSQELSVHDDLEICLYQWDLRNKAYPAKLRADDGTCSSVLSSQCISDLKKAAGSGGTCRCPLSRNIPSCTALGNDSAPWDTSCASSSYKASRIREWKEGRLELWAYGGATHDRQNTTAYNSIGSIAWPVMATISNESYSTTSLSCVRPKDAAQGSTAPTGEGFEEEGGQGNPDSSGSRISGNWFALGVIFVSYTLML